jgi:hypothetical protein
MAISKLEEYIKIIKSIMESGPLTFEQLTLLLRGNALSLKKALGFLVDQEMVKANNADQKVTYALAPRGIGILSFFRLLPLDETREIHA